MTPLDLTKKVTDCGYLIIFQTLKKELVGFKYKRGIVNYPNINRGKYLFPNDNSVIDL